MRGYLLTLTTLLIGLAAALQGSEPAPVWQKSIPESAGLHTVPVAPDSLGSGKEFSVRIQLRPNTLTQEGSLFAIKGTNRQAAVQLEVADGGRFGQVVRFLVTTDFRPKPLGVGFPLKLLAIESQHDLLLRDLGFRLDFFVDGVLADQDWPIGRVGANGISEVQATSAVRDVQIWPSALPDEAVDQQNGGEQAIAARELEMLGPQPSEMQYFRPRGYNTSAGDAMPFFHDGVLHVFYLLDRRHHQSKWGLGAHQWAHVSSTDLVHWKTYPMALTIDHEWEASICTGSVFFNAGKYYAFYATRMPDRSEHLGVAVGDDGAHFHKLLPSPFEEPKAPYRHGPNRDPFVFGEKNDFHMLVTASLAHPDNPELAGVLEHLTSPDLKTWKVEPSPFLVTGYAGDPECSDLFFWNGWYYVLFSEGGQAHYRMSRSRSRPWIKPATDVFDGIEARVMKPAAFTGDRRIGVAFVPDGAFGGNLVFRELRQSPDGTLYTTFPREMTPHASVEAKPASKVSLDATQAPAIAAIPVSGNFILKATLSPFDAASRFGFGFADEAALRASRLEFDPHGERIQWTGTPSPDGALPFIDSVHDVTGPIEVELVAQGTTVDLNVNGRHTLVHRLPATVGKTISVFCTSGRLTVTNLTAESTNKLPVLVHVVF